MALRVANSVEKNIRSIPTPPVDLVANTAKDLLPDQTTLSNTELMGRYVFNVGPGNVYYNIGADCDAATNFMGYIVPGQQLDLSNTAQRVSGFTTSTAKVAITLLKRSDFEVSPNFIGGVIQAV